MVNQQRIAEEFSRLASISSPAFGEGEISRYLVERLQKLGATVVMDDAGEKIGSESGNLIATFPVTGKDSEPLLVSVHMDTVGPAEGGQPALTAGKVRLDETTV